MTSQAISPAIKETYFSANVHEFLTISITPTTPTATNFTIVVDDNNSDNNNSDGNNSDNNSDNNNSSDGNNSTADNNNSGSGNNSTISNDSNRSITAFQTFYHNYSQLLMLLSITAVIAGVIVLTIFTIINDGICHDCSGDDEDSESRFWWNQLAKYSVISIIQFLAGLLVIYKNVRVNYTRKVVHIFYFIWPQLLDKLLIGFNKSIYSEAWNVMVILLVLIGLVKPIRERVKFVGTMFKAIDRPEDRPYTLFWMVSQLITSLVIIACAALYLDKIDRTNWIFIPLLILTVGDGLAEPIGVRFATPGTTYKVRGFLIKKEYTRSYQGSAWVWFFSVVAILIYFNSFTTGQIIFNILLIPVVSTVLEAIAPHTWDNPILLAAGYILLGLSDLLP
jgi:hypothetical protein